MVTVVISKADALNGEVFAPSSKSYTQRMVIAAALSGGQSKVFNPLFSEDTEATLRAVTALGAEYKSQDGYWLITGTGQLNSAEKPIDCGESGATLRFMIPIAALAVGPSTLLFHGSFKRRPVEPLIESLKQLGTAATTSEQADLGSIYVEGGGIVGGKTNIAGDISSQFISGLLFACPMAKNDTEINITSPLESSVYVNMTESVLNKHKISVNIDRNKIIIPSKQKYSPVDDVVPGDFSSAAFLLAAAAITKSNVTIHNLNTGSVQGDKAILEILKKVGVDVIVGNDCVKISGSVKNLSPIDINVKNIPDLVPVITVLACYATGTSRIYGAGRLRLKESDRLQALYEEFRKMGANIEVTNDGLTVIGEKPLHGAIIDPHNDHRIAMACTVAALLAEGKTTIQNAECIRKSYPQFYTHLKQLGAEIVGK